MKWIKLFEEFKINNESGNLITQEDIIDGIKRGYKIYSTIIQDIPQNDPDKPLNLKDIDEDGLITIEYDGKIGYVKLEDVTKIENDENKES